MRNPGIRTQVYCGERCASHTSKRSAFVSFVHDWAGHTTDAVSQAMYQFTGRDVCAVCWDSSCLKTVKIAQRKIAISIRPKSFISCDRMTCCCSILATHTHRDRVHQSLEQPKVNWIECMAQMREQWTSTCKLQISNKINLFCFFVIIN